MLIEKNKFLLNHNYSDIYMDVEHSEVTIKSNVFNSSSDVKLSLIELGLLMSTATLYDSKFIIDESYAL